MKAEHINPFLLEFIAMYKQLANIHLKPVATTVKQSPIKSKEIVIAIGVTGDLRGYVIVNLDEPFARKVASNMMGGMPVETLDEMAYSAICELENIIMGRVSIHFSKENLITDITPPSIIRGDMDIVLPQLKMISFKLANDSDDIEVDICISKKEEK